MNAPLHAASARSFTLVEILVATAVLCLLCLLLTSILNNTSKAWRDQEAKQEGLREATAALNVITRDVRDAVISTNVGWFYSATNQVAFLSCLPRNGEAPGQDLGDICVVGYSLEWGKANPLDPGEKNRMALYRYVRFSTATQALLSGSGTVDAVFESPDGITTVREVLARNVAAISCTAYSTNAAGPLPFVPDSANAFPAILDFSITTLNEETAAKLTTEQQWTDTNSPLIRQGAETYSLRVRPGRS